MKGNIEKLPSGSYRVRKRINGKLVNVTLDHKPSKDEVINILSKMMLTQQTTPAKMTLKSACEQFIEVKSNILSPSTIRGYRSIIRNIPDNLAERYINCITKPMIQAEVNRYSVDHTPKTTRNYGIFITTVLSFYGVDIPKIQYPQKVKNEVYIPTVEELQKILEHLENTEYYVPVFLGSRGLRLSEVCALTVNDLSDDNMLTINKAKVRAEKSYQTKTTKTTDSTRTIAIPSKIADIIREKGYIYNGYPNNVYKALIRAEDDLGIQHFPFHKLRAFFASYAHYMGFVDKAIQEDAGWLTDDTMKKVYRQSMKKKEISREISDSLEILLTKKD